MPLYFENAHIAVYVFNSDNFNFSRFANCIHMYELHTFNCKLFYEINIMIIFVYAEYAHL